MKVSYHGGHCGEFCDHAEDCTLEEVVKKYIEEGFTHFGLSEHQALGEQTIFNNYIAEAKRLKEEYSDKAEILVGFETEVYDKSAFSLIQELRDKHKVDYIVGSVHHVAGIPFDMNKEEYQRAVQELCSLEAVYLAYYEAQYQLIVNCQPEVIGHFDLVRIFSEDFQPTEAILNAMKQNIEAVVAYGGVFEVNARAYRKGLNEPYPSENILKEIAAAGGEVTLGDDSHGPEQVGNYFDQLMPIVAQHFSKIAYFAIQDGDLNKFFHNLP